MRNFLLLIQYHAVCGGGASIVSFFQVFPFFPNALLLILPVIFIFSIFILLLFVFSYLFFIFSIFYPLVSFFIASFFTFPFNCFLFH